MLDAQSLAAAAKQLTEQERVLLVEALLETLGPSEDEDAEHLTEAWRQEIRRRSDQIRAGNAQPIPWSSVRKEGQGLVDGGA